MASKSFQDLIRVFVGGVGCVGLGGMTSTLQIVVVEMGIKVFYSAVRSCYLGVILCEVGWRIVQSFLVEFVLGRIPSVYSCLVASFFSS